MLMTQLPIHVLLTLSLSFQNYRLSQKKISIVLAIITWKPIKINITYYLVLVVSINGIQTTSSTAETQLEITIYSEINFDNHLFSICNKVSRNINALDRIFKYMSQENAELRWKHLLNLNLTTGCFIQEPSIIKYKINCLHERALWIVYSDFQSSFEGLVMKNNSFSIHGRNIKIYWL